MFIFAVSPDLFSLLAQRGAAAKSATRTIHPSSSALATRQMEKPNPPQSPTRSLCDFALLRAERLSARTAASMQHGAALPPFGSSQPPAAVTSISPRPFQPPPPMHPHRQIPDSDLRRTRLQMPTLAPFIWEDIFTATHAPRLRATLRTGARGRMRRSRRGW